MNMVSSMCAIGQVKISSSEFHQGDDSVKVRSTEEAGGFVLWQKNPDLWCLELLISGCKVISGSNGKIAWRQSSNQQRPIVTGPPRPLRRFLQVHNKFTPSIFYIFIQAKCDFNQIKLLCLNRAWILVLLPICS